MKIFWVSFILQSIFEVTSKYNKRGKLHDANILDHDQLQNLREKILLIHFFPKNDVAKLRYLALR